MSMGSSIERSDVADFEQPGTAGGTVDYHVAANNAVITRDWKRKKATLTIGRLSFPVTQWCVALNTPAATVSAAGSNGSVILRAAPGCGWSASSDAPWLTVAAGAASGHGDATLHFTVQANTTNKQRVGTLTIGGVPFQVTEH
jgi:trimeric autotransporter adhesin